MNKTQNDKTTSIQDLVEGDYFYFPGKEGVYVALRVSTRENMTTVRYRLYLTDEVYVFTKVRLTSVRVVK